MISDQKEGDDHTCVSALVGELPIVVTLRHCWDEWKFKKATFQDRGAVCGSGGGVWEWSDLSEPRGSVPRGVQCAQGASVCPSVP